MSDTRRDFDGQASSFDQRAGLPVQACRTIACAIVRTAALRSSDLLLEVGAGTGQIGSALCEDVRYAAFDLSLPMLHEFVQRSHELPRHPLLVAADANRRWPVRDRAVSAVFGSRSLHLLSRAHVVDEVFRVAAARGASLLIGRVKREPQSVRATLQRRMHAILAARGHDVRQGQRSEEHLIAACIERGASPLGPVLAASWQTERSAADVLRSWRAKPLLGGVALADDVKERVLEELALWAATELGSLDATHVATEQYHLSGAKLPPSTT
jgi:ubiquinone/menaquinone biosynthesis C-methylase UbiE